MKFVLVVVVMASTYMHSPYPIIHTQAGLSKETCEHIAREMHKLFGRPNDPRVRTLCVQEQP